MERTSNLESWQFPPYGKKNDSLNILYAYIDGSNIIYSAGVVVSVK